MQNPRNFKDVSWLFFACVGVGAMILLAFNLRPSSFSGATALEVAQKAREATRERVEQSIVAVGDPDTTQAQINAHWQEVAESYDAPVGVIKCAKKTCASRTWAVEMRPGSVNGTKVWVAVCGWPAPLGDALCLDTDCNGEAQKVNTLRNTEIVVISDEPQPHLLSHVGHDPFVHYGLGG